ncbi:SGNH/GDSL hydrolase family protein [Pseudalkalibacillus caeni]|uniref:SGNH/GDSL hydrolase family protein n=1 Tax=Exobacillus caeni TaxID=2574798 RepID=A0A5R9F4G9_9BACL|nr:SGNH/GDSL hydrolase family protein [Pseudalkalibacillus caeni]TLS38582.1 hypothetical protein FCL54_03525 [Pseudalkalibacillus caeni]
MKKLGLILICIMSFILVIYGKIHWETKIERSTTEAKAELLKGDEVKKQPEKEKDEEGKDFSVLPTNLPEDIKQLIVNAEKNGDSIKMVAMGSSATSKDSNSWPAILQEKLDSAYGNGIFEIEVESYNDKNSLNIYRDELYKEIATNETDVLLLQPFFLKDSGKVSVKDTLYVTNDIIKSFKNNNDDLIVLIQPPNPIFDAANYNERIVELKEFAEDNAFIYLDHWTAWPDGGSEKIKTYLDEEGKLPSEKGNKAWAEYLADFFTGN